MMTSHRIDFDIPANYAFQDESAVYQFTNENISGYLGACDNLRDGNVLAVGASGDHAFEAYLAGAKHVDTFDINSYQRHMIELKTHMIRNLKYSAFMDYFFYGQPTSNEKILKPILPLFSFGLMRFFKSGLLTSFCLHNNPCYDISNLQYLSSESKYNELASKLPEKINFVHCPLEYIPTVFNKKYNVVMLSNIFDYMYTNIAPREERIHHFYNQILSPITNNILTPDNGTIFFNYIWNCKNPDRWVDFFYYFREKHQISDNQTFSVRCTLPAIIGDDVDVALMLRTRQMQNRTRLK